MKEPPLSRHQRKPSTVQKIKLLCSFNGVFQPRPPSGKLRYVGGETRIISVDRNISFLRFQSKISELRPLNPSFSLKYQLPESNGVDGDIPLVLVTTDEDVKCMIDEYDKLISLGKPHRRLWLFVCNKDNNGYVGPEPNSDSSSFTGFRSKFGNPTMVLGREGKKEIKSSAPHLGRIQNSSNDSLRKMVLEQQVMATQKTRCQSPCGFFISNTSVNSLGDIVYQPQSTKKYHPITVKSHCKSNAMNVSDYNNLQFTRIESQNFGSLNPSPESHIQGNSTIQFLPSRFGEVLPNRGELNAGSAAFQFLKHSHIPIGGVSALKPSIGNNRAWENHQCGIRNHRFGAGDIRNQRINSNYMRNHRGNLMEMGNRRAVGLDGKPYWLRPNSTISKHGQAVRSHLGHFWKPWSGGGLEHAREGMAWMIESSKDSQPSFNLKSGGGILRARILQPTDGRSPPLDHVGEQGGLLATGNPNPLNYHLGYYHGACHASFYQHLQPHSLIENYVPCLKPMTIAEDLSSGLNQAKHETASQTVGNNFHAIPMASSHCPLNGKQTGHDSSNEPLLKDPRKDIEITRCFIDRDYISGFKLRDNSRCLMSDKNVQLDPKTGVKTLISGPDCLDISSGVHLSLDNLSLSSSKEVEPPTLPSSPARDDVLETSPRCEMDLQQNSLDAMDEGHLSSSQSIGKSNGNASNCSLKDPAAQSRKDLSLRKDDQEDTSSSLCIDEKAEVKGSHICSKIVGGICNDLAAFYTHLATKELQTIKNSDLEDIRELGSGTYGTVYYGKWKGSDVAIKRIKPSCFTGSEEDRLIADFWKEAHMLGQLHHPNVVAFYGVVTDGPVTNLATVTEYMVNGSLKQVLRRKDRTIDRRKRLIIAMDAAFGMQYVHEKNIVHFDLKADNFLVNMRDPQRPVCKIGDLGLSKIKQRTLISGGIRGTIPWMAPELLNSKDKMVTEKVDVYSFGIVMWELLTGEEPYADMRSEKIIAGIIKGDLRPEVPSWCDPAWRSLMERCWSSDPELRPGFSEIAKELRAMSAAMNIK